MISKYDAMKLLNSILLFIIIILICSLFWFIDSYNQIKPNCYGQLNGNKICDTIVNKQELRCSFMFGDFTSCELIK